MKRVVFVTSHYLQSAHQAGFHRLAEAMWRAGWHVLFFTESLSWLSLLRGGKRFKYPVVAQAHRLRYARERMAGYVWLTPLHPINLRSNILNHLAAPALKLYPRFGLGAAEREIKRADLFVFDSDHGLFLFDRFKKLNPSARFVYRVSDDIRMMRHHPLLPAHEEQVAPRFDMVSVPSSIIARRFAHVPRAVFHSHGLDKDLFDRPHAKPYSGAGPHVIYVGRHYFDVDFVARATRLLPAWSFHVFGDVGIVPPAPNLVCYGERPFRDLIPYLQYADIGLQTLAYVPGAECFTDSLKMFQYTYCRLPIVAPSFLRQQRPHVFYYEPGDDASIHAALLAAHACDRTTIATDGVLTWNELAMKLAG